MMMTFEQAAEIMKSFTPSGSLLDGLEAVDEILRDIQNEDEWDDALTAREKAAFRIVVRKMRPLFA